MKKKRLKILVTAGPAWVPIDEVRVITNIFSGKLGHEIARQAVFRGHNVKLYMGPGRVVLDKKIKNVKRYHYFKELLNDIPKEIESLSYDAIIHSAAIADYELDQQYAGKIKSNKKHLVLRFKQTVKIVNLIKQIDPEIYLVKFKLEVGKSRHDLIRIARKSLNQSKADIVVANDLKEMRPKQVVYIVNNKDNSVLKVVGRVNIAKNILNIVESKRK